MCAELGKLLEELLGMGTDLRSSAGANVLLHFLPVLAKKFEGLDKFLVLKLGPPATVFSLFLSLGLARTDRGE